MDAAWKVYVGDRRFDDNQISNLFLKLKYETVGRFTFDFRPIDGDESYMVANNTLRIFWGDLHKLDGVIQRVDWDDSQYCYHVFGADIRGFLLDRVNTEPSTVNSYTSDIQTQVQYTGCDFPSNVWTGAGDKIGTYTFHYKLGIQNTIRITSATQNIWHNVIERGTVYEHQNGCLYDATKAWEVNKYRGATLRFVSGACKNNVYNVNGNTANRVCIRLPGEDASDYATTSRASRWVTVGATTYYRVDDNAWFDDGMDGWHPRVWRDSSMGDPGPWDMTGWGATKTHTLELSSDVPPGETGQSVRFTCINTRVWGDGLGAQVYQKDLLLPAGAATNGLLRFWYKHSAPNHSGLRLFVDFEHAVSAANMISVATLPLGSTAMQIATTEWAYWEQPLTVRSATVDTLVYVVVGECCWDDNFNHFGYLHDFQIYGVEFMINGSRYAGFPGDETAVGTVPGCSRIGDIYEIITTSMERIDPASLTPATLEKDNHIIKYNQTEELSDRTTVVTVMGAD